MDAEAEQLWLPVNSAPYRRLSGGRAEQCPLGHTTPSLQPPETSTLPPCLGPVLTGLLPRHCFSPSARQSRPDNRPGPPPQFSSGSQPAALLECLLRAGRCGGCWGRAVGLDSPPVRWSVQGVEMLTVALKESCCCFSPWSAPSAPRQTWEPTPPPPLGLQGNTSLVPCRCMDECSL